MDVLLQLLEAFIDFIAKLLSNPEAITLEEWLKYGIITAILILVGLYRLTKLLLASIKIQKRKKDLRPFYTAKEIKDATQYYIPTHFQNIQPTTESINSTTSVARQELIPFFVRAFEKDDDQRFYIILGDSGMGKTTFLLNLYFKYAYKRSSKYEIKIYPLNNKNTLSSIEQVPDDKKIDTILLLDALDEDRLAFQDYNKRIAEIIDKTWDFCKVIITSRTQFFANQAAEPSDVMIPKAGGAGGTHDFEKLYISPFDDQDIDRYLRKRYSWVQIRKRNKAFKAVEKAPNILVRPMLLNYIEDLIENDQEFQFSFQIYKTLIDEWIKREQKIYYQRKKKETLRKKLFQFSKIIALKMYENYKFNGTVWLDEFSIQQCADAIDIDLDEIKFTSRSLLTRNPVGEWEFAHKSIWEYFLALECVEYPLFAETFDFGNMEVSEKFCQEINYGPTLKALTNRSQINGQYKTEDEWKYLKNLSLEEVPEIRVLSLNHLKGFDFAWCEELKKLKSIETRLKLRLGKHQVKNLDKVYRILQIFGDEAYFNLALDVKRQGNLVVALYLYEKAIELNPKDASAYGNRGNVLDDLDRKDEALASYEKVIELNPKDALAYNNRGNVLDDLDRKDEALASYEKAIELNPKYASAYYNRGIVLDDLDRKDEALASYEKAIELNPKYALAYNNRGNVLDDLDRKDEALASYEKAIELNPKDALAYNNRGNVLDDLDRKDEALASFEKAIELNPKYALAYNNRGNVLDDLDRKDEALASFEKAIELNPKDALAYLGLSFVLIGLKQFSRSEKVAKEGLQVSPQYADLYTNLALSILLQGRFAEAKAIYLENKSKLDEDGKMLLHIYLEDFEDIRKQGIDHPDIDRIIELLKSAD